MYEQSSVASVAIAAHELGHAVQDHQDYFPLRFRTLLVPAVNIGSTLGWILIMIGLVINATGIAWLGVIAFSGGTVFALATLPVELNASARAKELLHQSGIIQNARERKGVNTVLNAAALTYVASLFTAVMQLLYWISLVSGSGAEDDADYPRGSIYTALSRLFITAFLAAHSISLPPPVLDKYLDISYGNLQ